MAWNEPGGSGGKDPWGNRNNQSGPPDLDQVLNKIKQRLGGLFGGKQSGGGSSGPSGPDGGGPGSAWLIPVGAIVLVVWALSGIYIIDPAERGVVLRFGNFVDATGPGPHWHIPYPIDRVMKVNVEEIRNQEIGFRSSGGQTQALQRVPNEALMLTEDENIVSIGLGIQYRVKDARDYLFNVIDPDDTLARVAESAVREIVGKSTMDFVLTEGRAEITARTEDLTQAILDQYGTGLLITTVNLQEAKPPDEVQDAFQDVVRAREDEQRLINEAQTYANGVIPVARGGAARRLEEAEAYKAQVVNVARGEAMRFLEVLDEFTAAPEIMRTRLYIEAIESMLSNSSKVLLDLDGNNNLVFLPLDQLIGQRGEQANMPVMEESPDNTGEAGPLPAERTEDVRRDRSRTRGGF